jgi:3',5'-cyclic-AMP phosphodiesterase
VLIAQITDLHIGFVRDDPDELNLRRLRAVLDRLIHGPNRPDLLLMSGDLTEFGDAASYARLAVAVSGCPFPVLAMAGNHDQRDQLLAAFPQTPTSGGFVQYVHDLPGLRLIVLDTLEPGRHGGAFCDARAEWLRAQLTARPAKPTVIAMHHPPFATGLAWLDAEGEEAWIARLADCLAGQSQVRAIISGHLHRSIHTSWQGIAATVAMSTAPAVALDLNPVGEPDGRAMITDEGPGYALHRWDGERLTSHSEIVSGFAVLASYDSRFSNLIQSIRNERREG